ncbi:Hpt domain-containing protein [Actinoplanes sp. NPDC048796]|uniref:Hpt domain-containing protein n=1 Tax=Actinoplanes sp. NPDC048796 TaxID=3155640 RepID=UPI0033EC8285
MERSRQDEVRDRMRDIAGGDPGTAERALMSRLIRSFLAKTPGAVDRLGELLRGGDPAELRDHAHTMKGSAANIGAGVLAGILAEVENAAREGFVPDPDVTLGRVAAEQALAFEVLERFAAELESS